MSPQNEQILKWMKANKGKWLNTLIAMRELGVCRLSERWREIEAHYFYLHVSRSLGVYKPKPKKAWQTVKTRYGKTRVMGYRL